MKESKKGGLKTPVFCNQNILEGCFNMLNIMYKNIYYVKQTKMNLSTYYGNNYGKKR